MKKFYDASICCDCLQAEANGLDSFEHDADFAARFANNPEAQAGAVLLLGHRHTIKECGREVVNGGADCPFEEGSFSWSSCDWCCSKLGGDRYPASISRRAP